MRRSIFNPEFHTERMAARVSCCIFNSKATSNTTSTTTEANITSVDNRVGESGAVFGGNISVSPVNSPVGALNISSTDQGALKAGSDLALAALDVVRASSSEQLAAQQASTRDAYALAQNARQSETSGAINNTLKYGALVLGLAVLAWAFVRGRK